MRGMRNPAPTFSTIHRIGFTRKCLRRGPPSTARCRTPNTATPPSTPKMAPEAPTLGLSENARLASDAPSPDTKYTNRKRVTPNTPSKTWPRKLSAMRFRARCRSPAWRKSALKRRQTWPAAIKESILAPRANVHTSRARGCWSAGTPVR